LRLSLWHFLFGTKISETLLNTVSPDTTQLISWIFVIIYYIIQPKYFMLYCSTDQLKVASVLFTVFHFVNRCLTLSNGDFPPLFQALTEKLVALSQCVCFFNHCALRHPSAKVKSDQVVLGEATVYPWLHGAGYSLSQTIYMLVTGNLLMKVNMCPGSVRLIIFKKVGLTNF